MRVEQGDQVIIEQVDQVIRPFWNWSSISLDSGTRNIINTTDTSCRGWRGWRSREWCGHKIRLHFMYSVLGMTSQFCCLWDVLSGCSLQFTSSLGLYSMKLSS